MTKGLVSIITPTFNCDRFIGETIESIQNQTYVNWELIIIDDCSNDNTEDVVENYKKKDERIRYYKLENNSGAAIARTVAMKYAEGEYMAFCDSDDIWMAEKLEKQIKFMEKMGYAFTCTAYEQIDEEGRSLNKIINPKKKCDYNRLLLDCPVGNSTVIYSIKAMGKYEVPNIRKRNDDALWLLMLRKEKYIWGFNEILTKYRIRADSISRNKWKVIKYHWILYRDIEHIGILKSIFHICFWGFLKLFKIK